MQTGATRRVVLNAFQPGKAVGDPESFAGRRAQVRDLCDVLQTVGTVPLIYGHRGLGKTSLALQVQRIALGDVELLDEIGAPERALPPDALFITLYVTCTDAVTDLAALLQLLVNAAEDIDTSGISAGRAGVLVDRTTRKALTLKAFEVETVRRYETEKERATYRSLSIEEQVRAVCDLITDVYQQPVLFIIDELDRVSAAGFASFIKANSSERLKFMLVGIATNVSALLSDHRSLERHLVAVEVPVMKQGELREIIEKAVRHLSEQSIDITVSEDAVSLLIDAAGGFPWFVHVLGQAAFMRAYDRGSRQVTDGDVRVVINGIVDNRFAEQFDDAYKTAVRDSYQRELVLKAFAERQEPDIPVAEVYARIRAAGVTGPSPYKSQLCSDQYGPVLITPNPHNRGVVRFANEMFKTYTRLRPAVHDGVDEAIAMPPADRA